MSVSVDSTSQQPFSTNFTDKKPNWGRRGSLMSKHVNALSFLNAMKNDSRRQSISTPYSSQDNRRQSIATAIPHLVDKRKIMTGLPPLSECRRQTITGNMPAFRRQSLAMPQSLAERSQLSFKSIHQQKKRESTEPLCPDEDGYLNRIVKKSSKRFQSRISTLDFDDDFMSEAGDINEDIEEDFPSEDKNLFFGEEFYLSDQKKYTCNLKCAKKILQQKKKELHERREEVKRQREIRADRLKQRVRPELPKLDMKNLETYRVHYDTINTPDKVPTLEEFVELLKDDEYYDPRYRNKIRQKTKKIAQRYYIARGMHRSSVLFSLANLPDEIRRFSTYRHSSRKSVSTVNKKKGSIDGRTKGHLALKQAGQKSDRNRLNTIPAAETKQSGSLSSIQERGQEVLGVTDSEPCKDHYIKNKRQSVADINPFTAVCAVKRILSEKEAPTPLKSPIFPKITMCEEEIESSDTDSEESTTTDDLDDETFDSKKLNLKYSIERLRKKRRSKVKKKAGFIEVLAKYYNMQNALRVFRKGSATKESKKARIRARQLGKKKEQEKPKEEQMVIGKLKRFDFLDVKNKKKLNLDNMSRSEFTSSNLTKFHKQLKKALDMFVVRREIVVSDITTFYTAATSVTFTKTSCFQHRHKSC